MKIEFSTKDKPQEWFQTIARQFEVNISNDTIEIPASVGKGVFKQIYFFEGLTLTYLHFKLYEPLEFIRHPIKDAQLFPIMFYAQETLLEQNIDEQNKLIGYHTSNGIFMPSPQTGAKWLLPSGIEGFHVTLTIEKNWVLQMLEGQESLYLATLLKSGKPFYLFEFLSPTMKQIIDMIHAVIHSKDKLQNFKLHQQSMELLNLFIEQLEQRTTGHDFSGVDPRDVQKLFDVRKQLLDNLIRIPSLKELSLSSGMSISKLQKCFQQVFGKSISQYALSEKMNFAKQMLDTKKHSVSEVGYRIGYSNLSHFAKAFKNEFGMNPKSYLNHL